MFQMNCMIIATGLAVSTILLTVVGYSGRYEAAFCITSLELTPGQLKTKILLQWHWHL